MKNSLPLAHTARQPGEIVTFYSYKGGTGRTMSLVNLACLLAERLPVGERILLLDWDLEAPGLHRYFHDKLRPLSTRADRADNTRITDAQPGLLDLFEVLKQAGQDRAIKLKRKQDVRARALLDAVDLDDYRVSTHIGNLDLMTAGRFDDSYGSRVNTFDWEAFYNDFPLAFRELGDRLKQHYRYIFIDSRTGLTDISGICTALMPEKLVLVFTPNRQNLHGIETILKQAVAYRNGDDDSRPLVAYPLPSRVDVTIDDIRAKWRFGDAERQIEGYEPFLTRVLKSAYGLTHCHLKRYFEKVQVKHSPVYAYGEEIAVLNERAQRIEDDYSLTRAYQNLLEWFEPGHLPWQNPELIALLRTMEQRSRGDSTERNALSSDLNSLRRLVGDLLSDGDRGNAELGLRAGLHQARLHLDESSPQALDFLGELTRMLAEQGRLKEASVLGARLTAQLDARARSNGNAASPESLKLGVVLALLQIAQGRYQEAHGALERIAADYRRLLGEEHPETLTAAHHLADVMLRLGNFEDARTRFVAICEARTRMLGAEHPDTQSSLDKLANTLQAQGNQAGAFELHKSVLATRRRVQGDEHPDTLGSMNNLANTREAQGDLDGALELQQSALATQRRVMGEEHPATLTLMSNLANTFRAQGDLAGALELQKSVLVTRRRVLGEEHPDTLASMNNLSATLYAQGDLVGALELQKSVLATQRRVLGEEHPNTLASMSNLAATLYAQGDQAGALELQQSVLVTLRRVLGEEHPNTLTSMNNLASTLHAQGNLARARELKQSVLAIQRRVLGDEHPDTLRSMSNLANTFQSQGDLFGALELQKSVLATRRRVLGEEHPVTLMSLSNLAYTLYAQGDLSSALELQKSVLATQRRVLGEEHPDVLRSMNNLAETLRTQGDLAGALELHKSVLATRRQVLGEEHPDTLGSMNNLANTLQMQGNLEGALEMQMSALATQRRVLGEDHPDILATMNNLANTLYAQGDQAGSLELHQSVLAIRRRVLGEEHPATLSSMSNLAGNLLAQGDLSGALKLANSALATRRRVLGDEHPDTIMSMNNLVITLKSLGKTAEADQLEAEVKAIRQRMATLEHEKRERIGVRVIGVGGAGCNAIEALIKEQREDVHFVAVNTDKLALDASSASTKLLIGDGVGAGGNPEVGRLAALKHKRELRDLIEGAHLLFIVAGLGGGTGSGASPVLADIARELGILTVAIATMPFDFEGRRNAVAASGERELLRSVDALVTLSNDDLAAVVGEDATMTEVFRAMDGEVDNVIRSIADVVCVPGLVNIDFEDLRTVLGRKGRASVANGVANGDDRAIRAARLAIDALIRAYPGRLTSASDILINITASNSLGIKEYKLVLEAARKLISPYATVVCGAVFDEDMCDSLRVTIVAAGFGEPDRGSFFLSASSGELVEGFGRATIKRRA